MNLSDLVDRTLPKSRQQPQPSPRPPIPSDPPGRLRNDRRQDMTAVAASSYTHQSSVFTISPQPPPSPPQDSSILQTLPSIQSLIQMEFPKTRQEQQLEVDGSYMQQHQQPHGGEHYTTGHIPLNYGQPPASNPNTVPPSPPIDPQLGFDVRHQSPSTTSSHSSATAPQYFGGGLNNTEPQQQRQAPATSSHSGHIIPNQTPYQGSPYPPSPSSGSNYSYPQPAQPNNFTGDQSIYPQRPLPNNFPPAVPDGVNPQIPEPQNGSPIDTNNPHQFQQHQHHHYIAQTSTTNFTRHSPAVPDGVSPQMPDSQNGSPIDSNNPNQFQRHQHHHYIAQTSTTNFTRQLQDRYMCPVCNKAFSRPSSLRIHSHSHTGEKPFVCPHQGCPKAFSVRSNMRRHERGCHGGGSPDST